MNRLTKDPLLAAARIILGISYGLIIFAMVMVVIGLGAVLTVGRTELIADLVAEGLAPATIWAIAAGLVAIEVLLFLALRFVTEFMRIVASVDHGDPFVPENADRLARMGWLATGAYGLGIVLAIAATWLSGLTEHGDFDVNFDGGTGIILILTLFILARVFRKGTEMREELEGTV